MRRFAVLLFALSLVLLTGAYSRDRFDLWIADTDMPALVLPTGAQILDRNGQLLRAYTVADGGCMWRWPMLIPAISRRFWRMRINAFAAIPGLIPGRWRGPSGRPCAMAALCQADQP